MSLRSIFGFGGGGGTVPTFRGTVANQAAMLALPAVRGDWCIRSDTNVRYELTVTPATTLANWTATPNAGVGGLLAGNNLSDVNNAATARTNLGAAATAHTQTASTITDFNTTADARADVRIAATRGAANGVASLDGSGLVPGSQLPSYVDDVLEFASQAAFPGTGETGKIYVALDANATFRWSGTVYVSLGSTPQYASQAEAEAGAENTKSMTALRVAQAIAARAKDALLTGWVAGANAAVGATDSISLAVGKLQAQITALSTSALNAVLTGLSTATDAAVLATDTLLVGIGKLQAQVTAKADLLPYTQVTNPAGNALSITKGAYANREVEIINAAGVTATFDFTGMAAGDSGVIYQGGAGVVTLAGATFTYAPGVTASPASAGAQGSIQWRYTGGVNVTIDYRSQAAAGGSGTVSWVAAPATITAPNDLASNVLQTLVVPGPIVAGMHLELQPNIERAGVTGTVQISYLMNGVQVGGMYMANNASRMSQRDRRSFFVQSVTGNNAVIVADPINYDPNTWYGDVLLQSAPIDISAGINLSITCGKTVAGESVFLRGCGVRVERPG
jgi:hypothetical protein